MFSFFKSKSSSNRLQDFLSQSIQVDIHSHLLPGIDDGAPDLETSLSLINELAGLGFKKLITTPHIRMEVFPNTPSIIKEKLLEVQTALRTASASVQLDAAAEYYIDDNFTALLQHNELIPYTGNKYILVEYPMIAPLMNYEQRIFDLTKRGLTPVIAHPERYRYWHGQMNYYERIKDLGGLLQLNILSVEGYYGLDIKKCALELLKTGLYDLVGTDLHNERHLGRLKNLGTMSKEMKLLEAYSFNNAKRFL